MSLTRSQHSLTTEKDLSLYFITPNESSDSSQCEVLNEAFEACGKYNLKCTWLQETSDVPVSTTNKDIFVFEKFQGELFDKVKNTKALIVGPRCLLTCLKEDITIPCCSYPVLSMAMRNVRIAVATIPTAKKEELRTRIRSMGGTFCTSLRADVTHLVVIDVVHVKCPAAMESNIPIMSVEWVDAVWEASQMRDVHATDEEFLIHKCPLFYRIVATTTNLQPKQKKEMVKLFQEYGGKCELSLNGFTTNLVIASKSKGDKYAYAVEHKIMCVTPEWVYESIKKNQLQPFANFAVDKRKKCSTPERDVSLFQPDLSTISNVTCNRTTTAFLDNETQQERTTAMKKPPGENHMVCESVMVTKTNVQDTRQSSIIVIKEENKSNEKTAIIGDIVKGHSAVVENLNVREAKKLGPFLDGCKVYLSGFGPEHVDKLRRILNGGGATRYDEISECVTHVIVGDFVPSDIKLLESGAFRPHVVSVEWLAQCVSHGSRVPEDGFTCLQIEPQKVTEHPSPLSKKGMAMLQIEDHMSNVSSVPPVSNSPPVLPSEEMRPADDLVQQYLGSQPGEEPEQPRPPSTVSSKGTTNEMPPSHSQTVASGTQSCINIEEIELSIFKGLTFDVDCFDAEAEDEIMLLLGKCGGVLDSRQPQYIIMPPLVGLGLKKRSSRYVNQLWLEDCVNQEQLLPIEYFHEVLECDPESNPLAGCVTTVSSYSNRERVYLIHLAEYLGSQNQTVFSRKDCPEKDVLAVTHLVCNDCTTQKYKAAVKWNIPVVTHEWLLACVREGRRVSETLYVLKNTQIDSSKYKGPEVSEMIINATKVGETANMAPPTTPDVPHRRSSNRQTLVPQRRLSSNSPKTPEERTIAGNLFSQETPLRVPRGVGQQLNSTPRGPFEISTPDTPYGQVFYDNPSPNCRKRWKKWIDSVPQFQREEPPAVKRRNSTPLRDFISNMWKEIAKGNHADSPPCSKPSDEGVVETNEESQLTGIQPLDDMTLMSPQTSQHTDSMAHNIILPGTEETSSSYGKDDEKTFGEENRLQDKENRTPGPNFVHPRFSEESGGSNTNTLTENLPSEIAITWRSETPSNTPQKVLFLQNSAEEEPHVRSTPQLPRVFIISNIDPTERRKQLEEDVITLGGIMSDKAVFDNSVTHLICDKPLRSEKLLASIAAGRWVLHSRYLEASKEQGHFLQEEDFEWGNPRSQLNLAPGSLMYSLAHAAYRWRLKVSNGAVGAFAGMKALIQVKKERAEQYKRLILAGGGQIISIGDWQNANICLVDPNTVSSLRPINVASFAKHRIPCVPAIFLNDVLVFDPSPTAEEKAVEEYKMLIESNCEL